MAVKNYSDLIVWQKSVDLVEQIYLSTSDFPKEEIYGLVSQMRRAAVSIPSNIAEGSSRRATKEFIRFLDIANGSLKELETQSYISERLKFLSDNHYNILTGQMQEVGRILWALRASLANKLTTT